MNHENSLDANGRELLFRAARTARSFADRAVPDELLREAWELARMAPTSLNSQPLRIVHVRSPQGRAQLLDLMDPRNRDKVAQAPVTSLLGTDLRFHEDLGEVYPVRPGLVEVMEDAGPGIREAQARFNGALQVAYFILAARAVGLSAAPMAGFDVAEVTRQFFDPERQVALTVVALGHAATNGVHPRLPRLPTDRVVSWA